MRSVTLTLLALAALTGCGSGSDLGPAPGPTSSSPPVSPAATSPAASPTASPAARPSAATAAPSPSAASSARAVYWLGAAADPRGPRLYREFVQGPAGTEAVRAAVEVMLAGEPKDPDYTSLWADGTAVRDVRLEGTTAVVDLSEEARTNGGGSAFEAATVQQLVHTVTAADPSLTAVRLLIGGKSVETLWGSVATSEPLTRGPAAEVLGPVWLDVAEGGTIDGEFGGTASVFEATVSWQLRRGQRTVQEGFSTASIGAPGRGTWSATADVPPGDYELWAYESSAKDGSVTWLDTKRVTVNN